MTNFTRNYYEEWKALEEVPMDEDDPYRYNRDNPAQFAFYQVYYKAINRQMREALCPNGKFIPEKKELKYMFTFTIDPKKVDASTSAVQDKIEKYIVDLIKRVPNVTRSYYVREHEQSNLHWHFIVHSEGFVPKYTFKYYTKLYGLVLSSKSVTQIDDFSVKYMTKEGILKLCKGKMPDMKSVEITSEQSV